MRNVLSFFVVLLVASNIAFSASHSNQHVHTQHSKTNKEKLQQLKKKRRKLVRSIKKTTKQNIVQQRVEGELLITYKSDVAQYKITKRIKKLKKLKKRIALLKFDESTDSFESIKREIMNDSNIVAVEPNIVIKSLSAKESWGNRTFPQYRWKKALKKIRKKRKNNKKSSARLKVGILDTGLDYLHPDLKGQVGKGKNFIYDAALINPLNVDGTIEIKDKTEMDYNGHGTMVAGIVGALKNDIGIDGMANNVELLGLKVFDEYGEAYLSDVIAGIDWAVTQEIKVLNMSFGTYEYSKLFETAIKNALQSGMIIVSSAGNDYAGESMYPAKFKGVINVGSHDESHWISRFSNWGDNVDFYAPGTNVISTTTSKLYPLEPYTNFNGTSVSAAYVTGVIALGVEHGLKRKQIKNLLKSHIIKRHSVYNPGKGNYKELNIDAMLSVFTNEPFKELSITKLHTPYNIYAFDEPINFSYELANVGTKKVSRQILSAQVTYNKKQVTIPLDEITGLLPGKIVTGKKTFSLNNYFKKSENISNEITIQILSNEFDFENNIMSKVYETDESIKAAKAMSMWIGSDNAVNISLKNTGKVDLTNISLVAKATPYIHELKGKIDTIPLGEQSINLKRGKSTLAKIPMVNTIEFEHFNKYSIHLSVYHNDKLIDSKVENIERSDDGTLRVQYEVNVHRYITHHAIQLLKNQGIVVPDFFRDEFMGNKDSHSSWPEGLLFPGNGMKDYDYLDEEALAFSKSFFGLRGFSVIDGSHDCDFINLTFGHKGADTWDSHFWIADKNDNDGLNYDTCGGLCTGKNHPSALSALRSLLYGNSGKYTMGDIKHGAIDHYLAGHKQGAWWLLGHAIHLIGDLSTPSHVNNENWHGFTGSAYHDWMDKAHSKWNAKWVYKKRGGYIDPYQKSALNDPLRFLAYTTAQVANSFGWAATNNTQIGKGGNATAGGNSPHYSSYLNNIFNSYKAHPRSKKHLNKEEVKDFCAGKYCTTKCQAVDWISVFEERRDCWGGGDGQYDYDNTDHFDKGDHDLSKIAKASYSYGIRAAAGLIYYFLIETGQLNDQLLPMLVPTVLD
ncbi:MAG: S8 family serine peptidase [Fibrobacterales bacterium]